MKLSIQDHIPEGFENIDLDYVHTLIDGPSLYHLKGESDDPLFISTLLHGNETTSFLVLQKLIKKYRNKKLPRDLIIFVGNTLAAEQGKRHLKGQPDYNRIWKDGSLAENKMAMQVMEYAREQNLFANIDIHNNTGKNPYYGCVNRLDTRYIELASYFSNKIVYFTEPHEVQSNAFASICPSVTIEAGVSGDIEGIDLTYKYVEKILHLNRFASEFDLKSVGVFHTIGRIKLNPLSSIDFFDSKESENDFSFIEDLETKNFSYIPSGYHLGYTKEFDRIYILDDKGNDITKSYIKNESGQLITNQVFIPSMFTKDIEVMKSDCLGYIMEKMPLNQFL